MSETTATASDMVEETRQQVRSTWTVSGLTLVSRVLGFLRLILLVQLFSPVRWASDAFIFAFRIPNLFRNLLGEGALSAAFIPVFVRTEAEEGKQSASRLGSEALTALGVVGGAVAVVGIVVSLAIDWLWSGNEAASLAFRLTALLFPFMPLVCLAALLGGMLQSVRRFALPAALSIILNLGFLAGFAYVYWWQCGGDLSRLQPGPATYAVSIFVLIAGAVEVLVQLPALWRLGLRIGPALRFSHPGLRKTLIAFLPVALGLGLVQINAFFDSIIAGSISLNAPGAVTYLEIGFRFMQLPLGVFGVAIATVSFPALASAAGSNQDLFASRLIRAFRMSLFLILPCSAVLIAMAEPIVRLTCQRPDLDFDHAAVYRSSLVLMLYASGLIFYSFRQILVRAYYARGEYTFPVKVSALMVGLNLLLNLTLIHFPDLYRMSTDSYYIHWYLSDASFPNGLKLGEAGLALATAITAVVDTAILWYFLAKRVKPKLSLETVISQSHQFLMTLSRMVIASAGLGILTWLYRNSIPYDPGFSGLLERVIVPSLLAAGSFYILSIVMPLPEMREFFTVLIRKRSNDASANNVSVK